MLFDNLKRETVSKREGYLCFFLSRAFSCPAYRNSPEKKKKKNLAQTIKKHCLKSRKLLDNPVPPSRELERNTNEICRAWSRHQLQTSSYMAWYAQGQTQARKQTFLRSPWGLGFRNPVAHLFPRLMGI
jgi:hypothetical protein